MYYHVRLTYGDQNHSWWNLSKDKVSQNVLIPFINGQIVAINNHGHKSLFNMKNVDLVRIFKTENKLSKGKSGFAPDEMVSKEFDNNDCTEELIEQVRELQSVAQSTSLLQKAFSIPKKQVFVIMKFGDKYLDSAYEGAIKPIISTSRKGLNMVNLVPIKETKANVQAHYQGYTNNPI